MRTIQPDIGDAVGDRKLDAILDTTLSFFRLCRGRASGPARRRAHREHLCLLKLDGGPAQALHVRQQILANTAGEHARRYRFAWITQYGDQRNSSASCLRDPARALSDAIRTARA